MNARVPEAGDGAREPQTSLSVPVLGGAVSPPRHRPVERCACGGPWPCLVDQQVKSVPPAKAPTPVRPYPVKTK